MSNTGTPESGFIGDMTVKKSTFKKTNTSANTAQMWLSGSIGT